RLSSPDVDGVIALSDDRIALLSDHAEVTPVELEMYLLARTRLQMNALESAKRNPRSSFHRREFEIELDNLIAGELAGVGDGHVGVHGLPGRNRRGGDADVAIRELRVAESVSEGIERLAREIAI